VLRRVDHVALAVSHREIVAEQGVEEAMFRLGDTYLQLVAPLSPDTPVGRFIERRGEGLHHIAYEVEGIEAALASAREHELVLVDEEPRRGSRNTRVAFVHPRTNHGVLVELVEIPPDPADPGSIP